MKVIKKHFKKFICILVTIAIFSGIFALNLTKNATDVSAKQNTFYSVHQKYDTPSSLKVLEVTASPDYTELGYYFVKPSTDDRTILQYTYGRRFNTYATDTDASNNEAMVAFALRRFGMVKPFGADAVVGTLSEYPIYDSGKKGLFGTAGSNDFAAYDIASGKLVKGHYELANNGNYKLADGYVIGSGNETLVDAYDTDGNSLDNLEQNYIYKQEAVSANTIPNIASSVSANTLINVYKKIIGGSGLPEGVSVASAKDGNISFVYLANKDDLYYGYSADSNVGFLFQNRNYRVGDWIKEYILGDAGKAGDVSYTTKTLNELTPDEIKNYDLIYISGTADEYAGIEMSSQVVKELYNQSAIYHKAVLMDYALYNDADGLSNLDRLALLLWQDNQTTISIQNFCSACFSTVMVDDPAGSDTKISASEIADIDSFLATMTDTNSEGYLFLRPSMLSGYNGNFAVNNVYVYNHHYTDFQSSKLTDFQTDALDNFANGDLNSLYTNGAISTGFQSVLAFIVYNNEKLTAAKNTDPAIDLGSMTPGYVTPAIAIQYILSYKGEDLALSKGTYSVLEIEPTRAFKFNSTMETRGYTLETAEVKDARKNFVSRCINEKMTADNQMDLVTFTSITIDQFNTMQTDLLSDYDLVYIGADYSANYLVSEAKTVSISGNGLVMENKNVPYYPADRNMTGNVYYNLGSKVQNSDLNYFSSRDLTRAKLTEMKSYLQNQGLVIVDGELMRSLTKGNKLINPTAVTNGNVAELNDTGRMDNSSNLYELFQYALGQSVSANDAATIFTNFISEADLVNNMTPRAEVINYLNRARVTLNMLEQPTPYQYADKGGNVAYLSADSKTGKYYLDYQFAINSSSALLDSTEMFEVHYYQDVNADGRFSETEELKDYSVTMAADDSGVTGTIDSDGVTHYNLNNGVVYNLRREIPSDEGGVINWCIKVENVGDNTLYAVDKGYTAIKPRELKYINALQIIPDGDAATVNLEALQEQDALYQYLNDSAVTDQYKITVRAVTVSQFEKDTAHFNEAYHDNYTSVEAMWQDYFNNFERSAEDHAGYIDTQIENDKDMPMSVNMLILGFGDSYTQFGSLNSIRAINEYVLSGKPVLTSNNVVNTDIFDTTNRTRSNSSYLLSLFGQDRYGYTNASYTDLIKGTFYNRGEATASGYIGNREGGNQAVAYMQGSARNSVYMIPAGYTNYCWLKTRTVGGNGNIWADPVRMLTKDNDVTAGATRTDADQMNEGQISHYPYSLNQTIMLSKSHAQNFQLDLDGDSDNNGASDIVVWYTLGDMRDNDGNLVGSANIYSATPGDGINNYYIYNNGNVTFTGFGANGESALTNGERQLFVNTLLAAYEAGIVNPTATYYQTSDSNAGQLESIAVPYDVNVTGKNATDSSIQYDSTTKDYLYKFVNPNLNSASKAQGTKAYFKVLDSNMVKGTKLCRATFYVEVDAKADTQYSWKDDGRTFSGKVTQIQLHDNTVVNVVRIPIDIYKADFSGSAVGTSSTANAATNPTLEVGTMYGFYVPMAFLNNQGAAKIYIKADTSFIPSEVSSYSGTQQERPLGTGFDMFTIIKQDLLKLD